MRNLLVVLTTAAGIGFLACGNALADTVSTSFEPPFALGSVNGQFGWRSAPPGAIPSCVNGPTQGAYDQAVVAGSTFSPAAPAAFGQQSLRMSNLCGSGEFTNQTYSAPVATPAGENAPNSVYIGQFSFISTTPGAEQPGLFMSVSPDSNEGSRMSWVGLDDTDKGIQVTVSDTPGVDGDFVDYDGPLLDRSVPHTIRFWIKVNPGPDNDLVRIAVDGNDLGQCFTTWENYYRTASEQAPPPNRNTPATINSLQFRTSVPAPNLTPGQGFLFDNVSVTTQDSGGPPPCGLVIGKQADTADVRAGGTVGYTITVRNRGRLAARHVRACDHLPRHTRFVRADHQLTRVGRARCLVIARLGPGRSTSFHLVLATDASTPPGPLSNFADVAPGTGVPGSPSLPAADLPTRPSGRVKAAARTRARVRIRARLPRVTG